MTYLESCNIDFIDLLPFGERPCRAKLIPSKVWSDLDSYKNDSKGLQNYCKKWRTSVKFVKQKSKAKVWDEVIAVGGEYWDRQCTVFIHTKKFDNFSFTDSTWQRFKFKFIQTLMHELIHFMQYDRRYDESTEYYLPHKQTGSKRIDEERKYYSHFDEIQAYAHCIYLDYKMLCPHQPVDYLLSSSKRNRSNSPTLTEIYKTFGHDFTGNKQVIEKLFKEILRWEKRYNKYPK